MNQFPFDGGKKYSGTELLLLASYDFIVLNSYYTQYWYKHFTKQAKSKLKKKYIIAPISTVVYPPVTLHSTTITTPTTTSSFLFNNNIIDIKTKRKPWIVLTGRFSYDI